MANEVINENVKTSGDVIPANTAVTAAQNTTGMVAVSPAQAENAVKTEEVTQGFHTNYMQPVLEVKEKYARTHAFRKAFLQFENMQDGFGGIQLAQLRVCSAEKFDKFANVATDANTSSTGTGLVSNNRKEVDKLWAAKYQINYMDRSEENEKMFALDYFKGRYANQLKSEEFVNAAFEMVSEAMENLIDYCFFFGYDYYVNGTSVHFKGLCQIISDVISNETASTVTDLESLDLKATTPIHYFDWSATTINDIDRMVLHETLKDKMDQTNFIFTLNPDGDTNFYQSVGQANSCKTVCWKQWTLKLQHKDWSSFKDVNNYINVMNMEILPNITTNPTFVDDQDLSVTTSIAPTNFGMTASTGVTPYDYIVLLSTRMFKGFLNPASEYEDTYDTVNNKSRRILKNSAFQIVQCPAPLVVVKLPLTVYDIYHN